MFSHDLAYQAPPFSCVHVENWMEPGDKASWEVHIIMSMNGEWMGDLESLSTKINTL